MSNHIKLDWVEKLIKKGMKEEDRTDVEFRALIFSSQVSDIMKYITHDKSFNPNARPYGTKEDEKLAFGDIFTQLMILCELRDIDIGDAIKQGLLKWEQKDWRKSEPGNNSEIKGIVASEGRHRGRAILVKKRDDFGKVKKGDVVILETSFPELTIVMDKVGAVVSDHGGPLSHAAIITREKGVPCIVGTGNATSLIKEGQEIEVDTSKKSVVML